MCGEIYMVPLETSAKGRGLAALAVWLPWDPCTSPLHTLGLYIIHSFTNDFSCIFLELWFLCVAHPGSNAKTFVGLSCTHVDVDVVQLGRTDPKIRILANTLESVIPKFGHSS